MRRLTAIMLTACFIVVLPTASHAIDIWHSNTLWLNQGICAFTFTLDGQSILFDAPSGGGVSDLDLEIMLLDEDLYDLGSSLIIKLTQPLAESDATRYAQFVVEGDCNAGTFGISKAIGMIGGKQRDLLETRQITPRKFEPKDIILPVEYSEE